MTDPEFLWWRNGVIYHLYLRSFADSNQDGLGDLPGLLTHLDYLSQLGIDAIWLSPIYPSPDVDYGYDISDYRAVDPRFGTLDDFDRLVTECHRRGINVILDMVLNHTSDRHAWFKAACRSRDDPFHDWYIWKDPRPGRKLPNNWESVVDGKAWEYVPQVGQYYYHAYFRQQPDLNWRNPQVKAELLDTLRFWLERGVDGFRLDVFNIYFKHAGFPNNPSGLGLRAYDRQQHLYDRDQPELLPVLAEFRKILDAYPERYMVGEPMASDIRQAGFYCGDDRLHQVFDFNLLNTRWDARRYHDLIQRTQAALPSQVWPCNVLSNHDVPRIASHLGPGEDDARAQITAAFLLTTRGTPFIYYGDEIGMRDISLRRGQILDPVGRRYWPVYKGRDGSRAPMQWDTSAYAGFSPCPPWLPVHPDYALRNVRLQSDDSSSLLNFYRTLIALRRRLPALHSGNLTLLPDQPRRLLAYLRTSGDQTVLVALNFSRRSCPLDLSAPDLDLPWKLNFSNCRTTLNSGADRRLALSPHEVLLLIFP